MFTRYLKLKEIVRQRSVFLFGARQTGKSTLLRESFPNVRYIDLLEADTFRELSANPELMRQRLKAEDKLIIIDEVQKLPILLDEVHLLIERNKSLRFILTGSSARKLKRGAANMLAGRAWVLRFHPLTYAEHGSKNLEHRLNRGGLPAIINSPLYKNDLNAYVGTYLREEIKAEGLTRSIENFSRFIDLAAMSNGKQLNFTEIGSDVGLSPRVIREYFEILQDTLLGHLLPAYQKTKKRKPVAIAKFYFFDLGVTNSLMKVDSIQAGSTLYGNVLEHLIFLELKAYLDYKMLDLPLTYWRSRSQMEVDFLVGDQIAIEVKAKNKVSERDSKHLVALAEEVPLKRKLIVCNEKHWRKLDNGIEVMPVEHFLKELWDDAII